MRTSSLVANLAQKFQSRILVKRQAKAADAKSILDLLTLAAEPGAELEIEAEGNDAAEAIVRMASLFAEPDEEAAGEQLAK